ncbi:MAG: 50S ribosomal protein L9 [Candidatus Peribacteraceae bacterium]
MEVLLLSDIKGIGHKNDLLTVRSGYALNCLLPQRLAIVATPKVRQQYADEIRKRAEEKQQQKALQESLADAISGKVVKIQAETAKGGKLYASVHAPDILRALADQFSITLPATALHIEKPIKSTGAHTVTVMLGAESTKLSIEVEGTPKK